jgi:phage terminase large subunit-like protein
MELLPDGRPRFRQLLVLVARQNGKTELLVVLSAFWMFAQQVPLILGTSTKLEYAAESWQKLIKLAKASEILRDELLPGPAFGVRKANGQQEFTSAQDCRYKIAASNEEGGRSLTVHRLIEDELRQHYDWSAHEAAENAINAVWDAQAWALSNAGTDRSVVLNSLRAAAIEHAETGNGDRRLGHFEWSAVEGADVTDPAAIAAANPNLNRRIALDDVMGKAIRARNAGGEQEAKFRTEVLCQRVVAMKPRPIPLDMWQKRAIRRARPAEPPISICIDIPPNRSQGAIAVAWRRKDGRTHVELARMEAGTDWVLGAVMKISTEFDVGTVCGDKYALEPMAAAFDAEGIDLHLMTGPEMAAACSGLQDAVNNDKVRHLDQQQVVEALAGAVSRNIADSGWAWAKRRSADVSVDISAIVAVTGAHWALVQSAESEAAFAFSN